MHTRCLGPELMPRLTAALALAGSLCACTDGSSPTLTPSRNPPVLSEIEAPRELFGGEARASWTPHGTLPDLAWILIEVEGMVTFTRDKRCWTEEFKNYCGNQVPSWLEMEAHGPVGAGAPVKISVLKPGQQPGGNSGMSLYSPTGSASSPVGRYLFRNTGGAQSLWTRRFEANPEVGSPTFPHIGYFPMFDVKGDSRVSVKMVPTPLRVDGPTTVRPGDTAAFTAQPVGDFRIRDGQGRTDVYWQYVPGDTLETPNPSAGRFWISCDKIECQYAPGQSGRLVAHTYIEGQPITIASAVIRVQKSQLELTCPDSVTRGTLMTCTVSAKGTGSLPTDVRWKFTDAAGGIRRDSSGASRWGGIMVIGGRMNVTARIDEQHLSADTAILVTPRRWGSMQVVAVDSGNGQLPTHPKLPQNLAYTAMLRPGTRFDTATVQTGPNEGWSYLKSAIQRAEAPVYISDGFKHGQPFYNLQHSGTAPNGNPYCTKSELYKIERGAREHEGIAPSSSLTSHVAVYRLWMQANAPQVVLEALVRRADKYTDPGYQFYNDVEGVWVNVVADPASTDPNQRHTADNPPGLVAFPSVPCRPRFFP